ncbi:MAG: hypothetical protein QHH09_02930 [Microgenomates group bacterium]|nr:hypothetical protein [Microgenomates group bacterium]
MGVENPFTGAVLVTASPQKRRVACESAIQAFKDTCPLVIRVSDAERSHDQQNGNGMLVPTSPDTPYPLLTALAKAKALIGKKERATPMVVTDSVYVIHLPSGQKVAINKPKDSHYPEKLVRLYRQYPGALITSDTGIVRIERENLFPFLFILELGRINPTFDPVRVFNTIQANRSLAAGMTALNMYQRGLLIPPSMISYQLYQFPPQRNLSSQGNPRLIGGGLFPIDGEISHLAMDSANNPALVRLSLGLLPV